MDFVRRSSNLFTTNKQYTEDFRTSWYEETWMFFADGRTPSSVERSHWLFVQLYNQVVCEKVTQLVTVTDLSVQCGRIDSNAGESTQVV